jgi:hypothetical protein
VDVLATEANIAGWKKIPDENKRSIQAMINKVEKNKDSRVNIVEDGLILLLFR